MKHRAITLATLALIAILLTVSPVLAYVYRATYTVTSENTTDFVMLGVYTDNAIANQWMADNGFMNSTANDTRIETLGGQTKPHMITDNATFTAIPVPASSQTNLYFSTGNSEQDFDIIPGYDGYVEVSDNATLEPGDNFTWEQSGWWDTDAGDNKTAILKPVAFRTFVSPVVSENITSQIKATASTNALDFERGNSDFVSVPDDPAFTFNTAGDDDPFSITGHIKLESLGASGTILAKLTSAGDQKEWVFWVTAANKLELLLTNPDQTNSLILAGDTVLSAGVWYHIAMTYNGDETATGVKLYLNGVDEGTLTDSGVGTYAGMTGTTATVNIGSINAGGAIYFDGIIFGVRIYDVELTATEVIDDAWLDHKATDLVALWLLTDGAGNPADTSGNGHNATSNAADWVTVNTPSLISVTTSGVASGEYIVATTANTTHMWHIIDGTPGTAVALGGAGVPDNSDNWTFYIGNSLPYCDNMTLWVGGTKQLWFRPNAIITGTTLPDRQGGEHPGTFWWGANPTGVDVTMGGLVSAAQPSPGVTVDDPTQDIMPGVEVTDWYIEPDVGVGGALLTNPMRPFVTMMSDTTTLTELQAWRWLGTALVLMVAVGTIRAVRGHLGIASIATAAIILGMVVWTIYPMWTLVLAAVMFIAGLIAERSPSL